MTQPTAYHANQINETAAREYIKLVGLTAAAILAASVVLSLVGIVLANALGFDAALVGGSIVALGIVIAALIGLDALHVARYAIVEQLAAHIHHRNAEAAKLDADAERTLAEADRIDAEAKAIETAAATSAAQFNINSGSGSQRVINKPIQYTVQGNAVGQLNLNQTNHIDQRTIEIPAADVRWFAEQLATGYGHAKGKWVGKVELPYSRIPVDYTIYKALVDPLASANPPAIVGRGDRASGKLVQTDPAQLVKVIEQTHAGAGSKGITLELPAKTSA